MTIVYQRANVGEAFVRGVEAEGEWIARRGTTIRGYVAYAYGQNESRNEPMRRIPPVNGLIGLRQDAWSGWWIEGSLQAASTQDRLAAGDIDDHRIPPGGTPGWWVVDVFAGKTFSRRLSVSAGILNLFNEAYPDARFGHRRLRPERVDRRRHEVLRARTLRVLQQPLNAS